MALLAYERNTCPHCGLHIDDCSTDSAEGAYTIEERWCRVAPILRTFTRDHPVEKEPGYFAWPRRKESGVG